MKNESLDILLIPLIAISIVVSFPILILVMIISHLYYKFTDK